MQQGDSPEPAVDRDQGVTQQTDQNHRAEFPGPLSLTAQFSHEGPVGPVDPELA